MKNEELFVTVQIPIRRYLKKFIAAQTEVNPHFEINLRKCHISALLIEPLQRDRPQSGLKEKTHLNDLLILKMGATVMKEKKFWFCEESIMLIDHRLKSMFDQQLTDYITMTNSKLGDIKASILSFMEFYNLTDDDIQWDTLTKMYYRERYKGPNDRREKIEQVYQLELELK